jgi:hypothetical protein
MIIGLTGQKGAGKDTVADVLVEQGFLKISIADPLKQVCQAIFHLDEKQLHDPIEKERVDSRWGKTPRQLFQEIGTELFRNQYDEKIWIQSLFYRIGKYPDRHIVIPDIRFQNECDALMELQNSENVEIFKVVRADHNVTDAHVSESGVRDEYEILSNSQSLLGFQNAIRQRFVASSYKSSYF